MYISEDAYNKQKREIEFSQLLYLFINRESLHTAVEQAAAFLGCSIVMTDRSFKVIDYSTEIAITDELWKKNIKRGYCTYDFVDAVNQLIPQNEMPSDNSPFLVNCSASTENKLCCKLMAGKHSLGYLILLDSNRGIQDYHYEYLPKISDFLVEFLKTQPDFHSYFYEMEESILSEIIKGSDAAICKQRLATFNISFPKKMYCVIFSNNQVSGHIGAFIESHLKTLYPDSHIFTYAAFIVAIMNEKDYGKLTASNPESEPFNHVKNIGISPVFSDISDLPDMFRKASRACHLSHVLNDKNMICDYKNYNIYDLLFSCQDHSLLLRCIHPALVILHTYDLEKETELFSTLRCYIKNNLNAKKSSEELFLHRNTLKYRLDKIQELTGLNLDDSDVIFKLELSYRINQLLKIY